MKKLIFGSHAIKYWYEDYQETPKDVDYICDEIPTAKTDGVEYFRNAGTDFILEHNVNNYFVDTNYLYTIKVSHIPWEGKNGKWWKHLKDIIFLKNHGCELSIKAHELLYDCWCESFGDKSKINLNKATEMFFKDGLRREFDHDYVHEYFAIDVVPAYKLILRNEVSPMVEFQKFIGLTPTLQYYTALEEMFVVAYERDISLPNAYKALVTRMTKGWWNMFLIQSAEQLLDGFKEEKEIYRRKRKELWEASSIKS